MYMKHETGRERIVSAAVLEILDNHSERLDDLRIWEVIEGIVNNYRHRREVYNKWVHHTYGKKVLKYWDSIGDPDGRAATRLVSEIRNRVTKRIEFKRATERSQQIEAEREAARKTKEAYVDQLIAALDKLGDYGIGIRQGHVFSRLSDPEAKRIIKAAMDKMQGGGFGLRN
jgi:hypothetical protein